MKSNALLRRPIIVPVAALAVSISVSGCQSTAARHIAEKTDQPPGEAMPFDGKDAFGRALSFATEERHCGSAGDSRSAARAGSGQHARTPAAWITARPRGTGRQMPSKSSSSSRGTTPTCSSHTTISRFSTRCEGRLDDARRVLLESLERRPHPITYASLGAVYTKLARDANERARELDTRRPHLAESEATTPSCREAPETSADPVSDGC